MEAILMNFHREYRTIFISFLEGPVTSQGKKRKLTEKDYEKVCV